MELLRVLAAFCAAEKTLEKKPDCVSCKLPPNDPFSGIGVSGAVVLCDNLLGPILLVAPDPDRILLCEIIFPLGEVTIFGFDCVGEPGKRGELGSVGVGGVLMIVGAAFALVDGGVVGRSSVSNMNGTFGFCFSSEFWLSLP